MAKHLRFGFHMINVFEGAFCLLIKIVMICNLCNLYKCRFKSVLFTAFSFSFFVKSLQRLWQFAEKLEKVGSLKCHWLRLLTFLLNFRNALQPARQCTQSQTQLLGRSLLLQLHKTSSAFFGDQRDQWQFYLLWKSYLGGGRVVFKHSIRIWFTFSSTVEFPII